ncbi:MAG: sulfite exporter TauE/SafE family protein, partial [Actinomycetota bacterium]
MTTTALTLLILLFFVTSAIGVVTGSNSLITVPVMFQFGIDAKIAVATNMFGLTFMNIGATIPFLRQGAIDTKKITPLVFITMIASAIGACLVLLITPSNIKLLVSLAMIAVTIFTLVKRDAGIAAIAEISPRTRILTYILTFVLGIYGGLYSGGYTTMLTALYVTFFGM